MKLKKHGKRIVTDVAGYGLLLAAALTGWLPGPGGIPLAVAGLGLLSIHNPWAQRLRDYVLENGGNLVKTAFPRHPAAEITYDVLTLCLFATVIVLAVHHSAYWQIALAVSLGCFAVFVALMNRDRLSAFRAKKELRSKHKRIR